MRNSLKILVILLASLLLVGCATTMPSWFQKELFVPSDARGTNIIIQVVNATEYEFLDVGINGVKVNEYSRGDWSIFQIGWGLVHGSVYRYRGRTTRGYPCLEVDLYCIGYFRNKITGELIMLLPEGWRRNHAVQAREEQSLILVFGKRSEKL